MLIEDFFFELLHATYKKRIIKHDVLIEKKTILSSTLSKYPTKVLLTFNFDVDILRHKSRLYLEYLTRSFV